MSQKQDGRKMDSTVHHVPKSSDELMCPCNEPEHFEKDLINIINNVKFTNSTNSFQKKLRADITEIKNSRNLYVFADKTNNIYRIPAHEHNKF